MMIINFKKIKEVANKQTAGNIKIQKYVIFVKKN